MQCVPGPARAAFAGFGLRWPHVTVPRSSPRFRWPSGGRGDAGAAGRWFLPPSGSGPRAPEKSSILFSELQQSAGYGSSAALLLSTGYRQHHLETGCSFPCHKPIFWPKGKIQSSNPPKRCGLKQLLKEEHPEKATLVNDGGRSSSLAKRDTK